MNGTITIDTATRPQRSTGNWATRGIVATGRGLALFGLTLAGLGLWTVLLIAVALAPLGVGLPLIAGTLRAIRRLAAKVRRLSADWCGIAVPAAYPAEPAGDRRSFWARFGSLITDEGTWRDLLWTGLDILVGGLLTLIPASLVAWGLFGVVMPAVWHPIVTAHGNNWYAFIHVTSASTAWQAVALGIASLVLGLATAPWFLRRYGIFARSVMAPTATA